MPGTRMLFGSEMKGTRTQYSTDDTDAYITLSFSPREIAKKKNMRFVAQNSIKKSAGKRKTYHHATGITN